MHRCLPILFSIITTALYANSQTLRPIVDENGHWSIAERNMGEYADIEAYECSGDTLINGIEYHALYSSHDSTFNNGMKYQAALRENQGEVWMFYRTDSMPRLLYDMTVDVGDSVRVHPADLPAGITLFVDSIRQEVHGGTLRKAIYLRDRGSLFMETWIEGIGSLQGVIYPAYDMIVLDLGYELVCYKYNKNLLYFNSENFDDCYEQPTGLQKQIEQSFVNFFPNPTSGDLWLEWHKELPFTEAYLRFYDSRGRLAEQHSITATNRQHVKLNLQPGIYFYTLTPEKAYKPVTGKLLVK